jgi:eukaryotic-like serine/threonine-protein kinase
VVQHVSGLKSDKTLASADLAEFEHDSSSSDARPVTTYSDFTHTEPTAHRVSHITPVPRFLVTDKFVECELIGQGGMGSVIRAFDQDLQRDVAIKVLNPESVSEGAIARFVEEARIGGRLEHPNIVPVHEFGTDEVGVRYLCMRLVDGETLEDTLNWSGLSRLEPDFLRDLLQVFVKVCDAVSFAHSRGILHRDLKPSNVMIGDFGQVYVVDWGVARTTPRFSIDGEGLAEPYSDPFGVVVGSPHYMAPEQLRGEHGDLDERTDVFALGATLYQILTGRPPHDPESWTDIALRKARVSVPPPETVVEGGMVPAELSRVALRAMSHDPADRFRSVEELKREIERFQRGR